MSKGALAKLMQSLFANIPCGVGRTGKIKFNIAQQRRLLAEGSAYVVGRGYGDSADLDHTESGGCLAGADPDALSPRAHERGKGAMRYAGGWESFC